MTKIQPIQIAQYPLTPQATYNAVKIDINNPQVNAPGYTQNPIQPTNISPVYTYPQAPIYEMPQESVYAPQKEAPKEVTEAISQPKAVKEASVVPPPPVVVPNQTVETAQSTATPVATPVVAPVQSTEVKSEPVEAVAAVQPVQIKEPEVISPKIDINEFITKLTSADYDEQAKTMESIANMAQSSPDKATELLDVRVVDTLLGIMNKDSSKLEGPTTQQIQIREKIIKGQTVSEAEMTEANKITPMEQAERNKQYAIFTIASLQKLYVSEIEKMNNVVVPLTELPGAAGIVEQIKSNPNPMLRASALDALSYIQRPEYKNELTTLFTIAQKDINPNVQQTATKALEKLAAIAVAQTTVTQETPKA